MLELATDDTIVLIAQFVEDLGGTYGKHTYTVSVEVLEQLVGVPVIETLVKVRQPGSARRPRVGSKRVRYVRHSCGYQRGRIWMGS